MRVVYHFKIGLTLWRRLQELSLVTSRPINKLIREFVESSLLYINLIYERSENRVSRYEAINTITIGPSTDQRSRDIYLPLSLETYKDIKFIHGKINNFSLAQMVRRGIVYFLEGVEFYGSLEKFKDIIDRVNRRVSSSGLVVLRDVTVLVDDISQLLGGTLISLKAIKLFIKNLVLLL